MTINNVARQNLMVRESGVVTFALLRFSHADLAKPVLLSSDPTELVSEEPLLYKTVSRGEDYIFVPMSMVLPEEGESAVPRTVIEIMDIDRSLREVVRAIPSGATMELELVMSDQVDVPIRSMVPLSVREVSIGAGVVSFVMQGDLLSATQWPGYSFNVDSFPALYNGV